MRCCARRSSGRSKISWNLRFHATRCWRFVEHSYAVAHVLERDAEFFLALAYFIQQPRVLHRDHRLGGEVLQQCYLFLRERADFSAPSLMNPRSAAVLAQRHQQAGPHIGARR